ncbi:MAG: IPTL-CTERM sorting domain-containing protein [Chitinophagales bacterium]
MPKSFTILFNCLRHFVPVFLLVFSLSSLAQTQIVPDAGTTTTIYPSTGDSVHDASDGMNGGPGGDCSSTIEGPLGNYPNCGCITVTTYCAPPGQQISINFTEFRVFGNFDWLAIFDGAAPVTASNSSGSSTNPTSTDPELYNSSVEGEELSLMVGSTGTLFTSTNGCLTLASRFSTVVNTCGWSADVQLTDSTPPVPTLSEWGLLILALLLMTVGTLVLVQPKKNLNI